MKKFYFITVDKTFITMLNLVRTVFEVSKWRDMDWGIAPLLVL